MTEPPSNQGYISSVITSIKATRYSPINRFGTTNSIFYSRKDDLRRNKEGN